MASPKQKSSRKSMADVAFQAPSGPVEKENLTTDITALARLKASASDFHSSDRRTRSKSIGPGGLDALKDTSGNRRKTAAALPRSILKPSVPLSPLTEIPTRSRTASPNAGSSPAASSQRNGRQSPRVAASASPRRSPARTPFSPGIGSPTKTVSIDSPRTQAAVLNEAEYKEAREKRQREREAIKKQREDRRKSMANRRVSFAPEATLHTWDHIEDNQDSTTSSASTDATRRASSTSNLSDDPPSTPPQQLGDDIVQESPVHQQDLHQKRRRRQSSGIPPMNFNNPEDEVTSTTYTSSSVFNRQSQATQNQVEDETDLGYADDEYKSSEKRRNGTPRPQKTAGQPYNQELAENVDENGELTMEMADEDVTAAFKPWAQQVSQFIAGGAKLAINGDQENVNPFSPAFKHGSSTLQNSGLHQGSDEDDGDMSMDITHAIGGIVQGKSRQSLLPGQNQPSARRRSTARVQNSSSSDSNLFGDDTMDFTAVVGGIQPNQPTTGDNSFVDQNEELSMEFTSVFGGIQSDNKRKSISQRDVDTTSDLKAHHMKKQPLKHIDADGDTEMTMDFDDIVNVKVNRSGMSQQTKDATHITQSSIQPLYSNESVSAVSNAANLEVPTTKVGNSAESKKAGASSTPSKSPQTPSKQITPQLSRPLTPSKTPTPQNVTMRTPSPRKLFRKEIKQAAQSPQASPAELAKQKGNAPHGWGSGLAAARPNSPRKSSGIGFDKEGLGSPRVADLLDRRASIGERADVFAPRSFESREVRFQDPRKLIDEVSKDRQESERRESGQFILEKEAGADVNEEDNTVSLKEAIESMTPKKNKFKGRKSLAVGSAKGLLGKRPAELDDEDDEDGTPQGLKGRQASPVKRIRLQAPPSASETTGRVLLRRSMGATAENNRPFTPVSHSPVKKGAAMTPSRKGHSKDAEALPSAQKPIPVLGQSESAQADFQDSNEERIHLQDFLNMTNIRFMELNTTKRRHTTVTPARNATSNQSDESAQDPEKMFADAVVAGACTLPMLELFQHSCRELKKYISDGRKVVREIESNTFEDNPPLFREYMAASPQERAIMDNQFKHMKTHARLLSKGMWYEWRMKLLEGLKEGLMQEAEGLKRDTVQLEEQGSLVEKYLPSVLEEHTKLEKDFSALQKRANELANCDQDELREARQRILSVDEQIRHRRQQIEKLEARSIEMDSAIEDATDAKFENVEAIKQAQKMLSEYRGWSADEVQNFKANVEALEAESGWSIVSVSDTTLTMVYRSQLQLVFDVSAFLPAAAAADALQEVTTVNNSPIRLSYIGETNEKQSEPLTTEKRFFLQLMQAHIHAFEQRQTQVKDLLYFISSTWTQTLALREEIQRLGLENLIECSIVGDERMAVRATMLLPAVQTKVNIWFELAAFVRSMDVVLKLKTRAEVVYGEQYREDKMRDFLKARIGEAMDATGSRASWADAFRELKSKLIARGRK